MYVFVSQTPKKQRHKLDDVPTFTMVHVTWRNDTWKTYSDEAIKLATSEYLHRDCLLLHATHWGLPRSHCGQISTMRARSASQQARAKNGISRNRIATRKELTFVFLSTHSSQLKVGLLRFCLLRGVGAFSGSLAAVVGSGVTEAEAMAICAL
jgi:hypothetical protein